MPRSRMRGILPICVVLLALCAGCAQAVLVNFDDVPGSGFRSIQGNRYISLGVLLSTDGVAGLFVHGPASWTNTPPNFCFGSTGVAADSKIIIDFVVPNTTTPALTDIVWFYVADADTGQGQQWSAAIEDANGNVLASQSGTTNDEVLVAFTRPTKVIRRVVFTPSTDWEGIDSLSFCETVPVPEPASLSVLGLGVLGLILRRRR